MANLFVLLVALSAISFIACDFAHWNAWSTCSVECGTGIKSRERIAKRQCGYSEIIQRRSCSGICKRGALLSKGKKVSASSTFLPSFKSKRIVDGNKNNDFYIGKSCFMTEKDAKPWIKIDLTGYNRVSEVVLYNRGDCCQSKLNNVMITIGYNSDGMKNDLCSERRNMRGVNVTRMLCFKPLDGRYVYITIPGPQFLTVCELDVYGRKATALKLKSVTAKDYLNSVYGPKKAIDNKPTTYYHSSRNNKNGHWLRVDLGKTAVVYEVDLRTYTSRNNGYLVPSTVYVGSTVTMTVCDVVKSGMGSSNTINGLKQILYKIKCRKPLVGRYIKVVKNDKRYLLMSELRVLGYYL